MMQMCKSIKEILSGIIGILAMSSACYTADLDQQLEGVFRCEQDSDCIQGFTCQLNLCMDNRGPELKILNPEWEQVHPTHGEGTSFFVNIAGRGLELSDSESEHVLGEGRLEIRLDQKVVGLIVEGSLEEGVMSEEINWPLDPGLHRISVIALRNDGKPYVNLSARAHSVFWVDNGSPQVGIVEPLAGDQFQVGDSINVHVAAINFNFVDPASLNQSQKLESLLGHVHLFLNRDIPDCLGNDPSCNGSYLASIFPKGGKRSQKLSWVGMIPSTFQAGNYPLSIVAQDNFHQPYLNESTQEFIFDTVMIQVQSSGE